MTTLAEVRESIEVLRRIEDSWPYPYEVFEQHVERLRTWLDAQPAAMWLPVEDGCHGNVRQRAGILYLDMGIEDDERIILLPAGYALCRRVE